MDFLKSFFAVFQKPKVDKTIMSIDEIVGNLASTMSKETLKSITDTERHHLHKFHHGLGRYIRNDYGLWQNNPLTEKWRTDESSHDIVNGVDYSKDHPDAISMRVIEKLWEHLKSKEQNGG